MPKQILFSLLSALVIIGGTLIAIQFAKGYRPDLKNVSLRSTGLLVANSFPDGAQVYINNKLTTATDDTLNLPPGEYDIEIKKDGYTSWKKHLLLKAELVTQTNATLFPAVPTLKPLTFIGAKNPIPSPDGLKIAYIVENASTAAKNGLWVLDLSDRTFILDKEPRQVTRTIWSTPPPTKSIDSTLPYLTWSPDSHDILISFSDANYLIDSTRFTDTANLQDVSARLPLIFSEWEETLYRKETERFRTLPREIQALATESATNIYFAPSEDKILYTATKATTIPEKLIPDLPAESTQPEERNLEPGAIYVYDLKEDKNFRVFSPAPAELGKEIKFKISLLDTPKPSTAQRGALASVSPGAGLYPATSSAEIRTHTKLQQTTTPATIAAFNTYYWPQNLQNIHWFPNSIHLVSTEAGKITISEHDGTNPAVVYANSFVGNFVISSSSGSQLIILTNLSQDPTLIPNLYSINLK